jgi:hypothetical protein
MSPQSERVYVMVEALEGVGLLSKDKPLAGDFSSLTDAASVDDDGIA